jgi:hypothetical protein
MFSEDLGVARVGNTRARHSLFVDGGSDDTGDCAFLGRLDGSDNRIKGRPAAKSTDLANWWRREDLRGLDDLDLTGLESSLFDSR